MGEKRIDLKVGFACNNNCRFCVVANKRCLGDKTTGELKQDLGEAKKSCNEVVFTGGEPTIRKDILELVSYAHSVGFDIIQIQTNGRMFSYSDFCRKIINAGANRFGISIHGNTAALHDSLTRAKNSFRQTVQGIKNLVELNQIVSTNTVAIKRNFQHMKKIAEFLVSLNVSQYQLAFVHPMGNAYTSFNSIVPKMSEIAPFIREGLQIGIDAGINVMVEAMPYCMMHGYEEDVSDRLIPDTEIREAGSYIKDYKKVRIEMDKVKFPQCNKCKYSKICEGVWKEYAEKYGGGEFMPVKNSKP